MEEIVELDSQDVHAGYVTDQQQEVQMNDSQIWVHDHDHAHTLMFYSSSWSSSSSSGNNTNSAAAVFDGVDHTEEMMMETFGCTDFLEDGKEFFDPACIFEEQELLEDLNLERFEEMEMQEESEKQNEVVVEEDMAKVFLEWLKSNRETVSAEDLKNVRIKKATIYNAARRLGPGKDGMKQLLKLVLQWVQTNHLHKKKLKDAVNESETQNLFGSNLPSIQNPSLSSPSMPGYIPGWGGDAYDGGQCQLLDSSFYWTNNTNTNTNHFSSLYYDNSVAGPPPALVQPLGFADGYSGGQQYSCLVGCEADNGSVRLSSLATKEARMKRMARQRRLWASHRHILHGNTNENQHFTQIDSTNASDQANAGDLVYLPSPVGAATISAYSTDLPPDRPNSPMQNQSYPTEWKPEKNLRFLLQKVLKQSDVGSLGRIVLPKKEAETHLPELDGRDGISIAMEDIATSTVWNMRYRYWPNNKSRMYLLDNTGDFVKANGLQEGDFIVIYSDDKCGKYMIRGVKVQLPGSKPESKSAAKSRSLLTNATNGAASLPIMGAISKRQ